MSSGQEGGIRAMREICMPEEKMRTAPVVERLFIEIGFLFTRLFVRTKITPNQITWFWGIALILIPFLFLFNDPWLNVAAALGWIIFISMDNTDGQVARYKEIYSKRGQFLDLVIHCITYPLLFFCMGLGQYLSGGGMLEIASALIAGGFMTLTAMLRPLYNSVSDEAVNTTGGQELEGRMFGSERAYKMVRDINPLTFVNVYVILLAVTVLNLAFGDMVLTIGQFSLTGLLPLFLLGYAAGFLLAFLIRLSLFYVKLK